jgi:hypothetical protein
MFISYHQNSGQNRNLNIASKSFENVADYKYLETAVTNKNHGQKNFRIYHIRHAAV